MESKGFVGIENAARIPKAEYVAQMQIRAMAMPGREGRANNPLFKLLAQMGFGQDPITDYWGRKDKST